MSSLCQFTLLIDEYNKIPKTFNLIPFFRRTQDFDRVAARTVQQRRVPGAQGQTQVFSPPGMQVTKLLIDIYCATYLLLIPIIAMAI